MKRCIIVAPLYDGSEQELLRRRAGDVIICADGGYAQACRFGITPDLVIGDFDSMPEGFSPTCETLRLPVHKDDTDLVVCLRWGHEQGFRDFVIAGAIGGRLDHTIAAMQAALGAALTGDRVLLVNRTNRLYVLTPGTYDLREYLLPGRKLSLLAATDVVTGVTLTGALWELHGAELTSHYPLGISNEALDAPKLSFEKGALYLVSSRDGTV